MPNRTAAYCLLVCCCAHLFALTLLPAAWYHRASAFLLASLLLATAGLFTVHAQSFEVLPPSNQLVVDAASLMSPGEVRALEQKLVIYDDTTSTQIVVVTVPRLNGVPAADYAIELGRQWGVGQQGRDNGVVILVSRDDRDVFIATGYGIEGAITDAVAARVVRNILVPNFREGRFYAGLDAATDALIAAASGEFAALERTQRSRRSVRIDPGLIFLILFIIIVVLSGMDGGGGKHGGDKRQNAPGEGGAGSSLRMAAE